VNHVADKSQYGKTHQDSARDAKAFPKTISHYGELVRGRVIVVRSKEMKPRCCVWRSREGLGDLIQGVKGEKALVCIRGYKELLRCCAAMQCERFEIRHGTAGCRCGGGEEP